jgi:hypothetical protein
MFEYDRPHGAAAFGRLHARLEPLIDRVGDLAEDVDLDLLVPVRTGGEFS